MEVKIRKIKQEDNASLSQIIKKSLEDLNCALPGTVYTDEATDHLFDSFQEKGSVYYVAEVNGEVLGGAGIGRVPNETENYCELQRMFLSEKARGKGIGTALMNKCIDFAQEQNYELIYIETFPEMNDARKLYEKSGFDYVDYRLGDTGHFSCDVTMVLPLK